MWTTKLREVGTYWYVVEQDTFKGDPLEGVNISFDYFKDRGMAQPLR